MNHEFIAFQTVQMGKRNGQGDIGPAPIAPSPTRRSEPVLSSTKDCSPEEPYPPLRQRSCYHASAMGAWT